jgi:hypothetical protein
MVGNTAGSAGSPSLSMGAKRTPLRRSWIRCVPAAPLFQIVCQL